MRRLDSITDEEFKSINEILSVEYWYTSPIKTASDLEYQCFSKSHALFSGYTIIKVYEFLKSVGIEVNHTWSSPTPV
jgi:hypothetical protein